MWVSVAFVEELIRYHRLGRPFQGLIFHSRVSFLWHDRNKWCQDHDGIVIASGRSDTSGTIVFSATKWQIMSRIYFDHFLLPPNTLSSASAGRNVNALTHTRFVTANIININSFTNRPRSKSLTAAWMLTMLIKDVSSSSPLHWRWKGLAVGEGQLCQQKRKAWVGSCYAV